jgi:hypothetical protein
VLAGGELFSFMLSVDQGLNLRPYGSESHIHIGLCLQAMEILRTQSTGSERGALTCHDRDRPNIAERDCGRDWLSILPIGPILEGTGAARDDALHGGHERMRVANAPWAASDDDDQTYMHAK